eukprot:GHVR01173222.1.p1 GENE.GHVR01173222.1~~GHVR01173222.1.p1  ORF type:complete len:156 (-),score=32.58 GHVR01173222.1:488-955(-)
MGGFKDVKDVVMTEVSNRVSVCFCHTPIVHADGVKFIQHMSTVTDAHDAKYVKAYCEAEAAAVAIQEDAVCLPPASRRTQSVKSLQLCREAQDSEAHYAHALEIYNACLESHRRQMNTIMSALQDMEEKRIMCFKDALMKSMVYETSKLEIFSMI